jgi:hypothetical protein
MFIESSEAETDEQFRSYVLELLKNIYGRIPDWLDFQLGRRAEFDGVWFREFVCPAGSVGAQIHIRALRSGSERAMVLFGETGRTQRCWIVRGRAESEINCSDIRVI